MSLKHVATPSYWTLEEDVSYHFNRAKGKMLTLFEHALPEGTQCEAGKSLIKSFLNEEYEQCLVNMRIDARSAGFIGEGDNVEGVKELDELDK